MEALAKHLPIKKRRIVIMDSSPSLNNASSSQGTESVAQDANAKAKVNCMPAASLTVADLHQSESNDSKLDVHKCVTYSRKRNELEDISGTSVALGALEVKANSVKLENMSANETAINMLMAAESRFIFKKEKYSLPISVDSNKLLCIHVYVLFYEC
ncbi:hypothetical protein Hanom_Chr09g00810461 [Helianthus anomalus]